MSEDTRNEIEGLIALFPWIVFIVLIAWSEIAEFVRERRRRLIAQPTGATPLRHTRQSTVGR